MISIVLLLKILGGIGLVWGWGYLLCRVRRTERRLGCFKEHFHERLTAIANAPKEETPEGELLEARRKAVEAERLFTEGIASILGYEYAPSAPASDILAAGGKSAAGERKGD